MAVWSTVSFSALTDDLRIDAEHYRPDCLAQAKRIAALPHKLLSEIADISDGNHISIAESFTDDGVRYLRGQDLADFFIADKRPVFIPESTYATLKRSHMRPGDILVGIVATIGTVSLVTDRFGKLTGNCKIGIIRPKAIESEFLAIFFLSALGQREIHRWARGTVQTGVILPDLKKLPIPIVSDSIRRAITERVRAAHARKQEYEYRFSEAEAMLNEALGLADLELPPCLFYEARFADASTAARLDAEFFQPHYTSILDHLRKTKPESIVSLGDLLTVCTNGHTPLHHDLSQGETLFLTAEHVSDFQINYETDKRILAVHDSGELSRTSLKEGDVLITIKGKVGNCAVIENLPGSVNINQDVALVRPVDRIPLHYFCAYLNSIAGKLFVQQLSTNQINPFLALGNLRKIPFPVYSEQRMAQYADKCKELIHRAVTARRDAYHLLHNAKLALEIAIEDSEAAAMRFLKEDRG